MFVFKDNFHSLSKIMVKICILSSQQGIFLAVLKRAKVTPIYKTNERWSPKNYRPISVLCPFCEKTRKSCVHTTGTIVC